MTLEVPTWLSADYFQRILRFVECDNTIQVTSISSNLATDKGDNYVSDLIRVMIEYTRNEEDKMIHETKSLMCKVEPLIDGARKELMTKLNPFDTEISMLMDTLKKINDMLSPESRLSVTVYHVRMERPLCLVMEDLSPLGFRMANRLAGFDLLHSLLVIQRLAKLHAASVALCEKEPKYKKQYRNGIFGPNSPREISDFLASSCNSLAEEVESWPELGKPYADKIRTFGANMHQKAMDVLRRNDDEFNVINHGDCWVNNMLFRYNDNSEPTDHIFVDFQMSIYTSPAIDLQYFMATSLSEEVYRNNRDILIDEYLRTLSSTMARLNCETPSPGMDELKGHMKNRAVYHLIATIGMLPTMLTDKSDVIDMDDIVKMNDFKLPGFKSPIFRRIMGERMPKFVEMGLLDP